MSHSNYTASERRGILVIAFIALLLIGGGTLVTLCNRQERIAGEQQFPIVKELPELMDTTRQNKESKKTKKKTPRKKSGSRGSQTYRQRSPLDEPI